MKIGDSVRMNFDSNYQTGGVWDRIGLVLGFSGYGFAGVVEAVEGCTVLVFWGEDFPYEEEYIEQLDVING